MNIFCSVQTPSSSAVRCEGASGDLTIRERVQGFDCIFGVEIVEYGGDTVIRTFDAGARSNSW